jgi:hypothetical protein
MNECNKNIYDIETRIKKMQPKKYYLTERIIYDDGDDEFVNSFDVKCSTRTQADKEKFARLMQKYIVFNNTVPSNNRTILEYRNKYMITRVQPLILEVQNNKCHLYGWIKNNSRDIIIPIPKELTALLNSNRLLYQRIVNSSHISYTNVIFTDNNNIIIPTYNHNNNISNHFSSKYSGLGQLLKVYPPISYIQIDCHFTYDLDVE